MELIAAIIGGLLYRARGAGPPWDNFKNAWKILFCFPAAAIVFMTYGGWLGVALGLLSYAGAFAGISTGHGQYFLARVLKPMKPERLDFIVRLFLGPDPRTISPVHVTWPTWHKLYWRCSFGMAITGLAVTIVPGIVLAFADPLAGGLLAVSGLLKAPAYMIPYALRRGTEDAELLFGAIIWAVMIWAI